MIGGIEPHSSFAYCYWGVVGKNILHLLAITMDIDGNMHKKVSILKGCLY